MAEFPVRLGLFRLLEYFLVPLKIVSFRNKAAGRTRYISAKSARWAWMLQWFVSQGISPLSHTLEVPQVALFPFHLFLLWEH